MGLSELPKERHPLDPVPEGGVWAPPPMVRLQNPDGGVEIQVEARLLSAEAGYLIDGELLFNVEGWGRFRLHLD